MIALMHACTWSLTMRPEERQLAMAVLLEPQHEPAQTALRAHTRAPCKHGSVTAHWSGGHISLRSVCVWAVRSMSGCGEYCMHACAEREGLQEGGGVHATSTACDVHGPPAMQASASAPLARQVIKSSPQP